MECCTMINPEYKIKGNYIYKDGVKYAEIIEHYKKSYLQEINLKAKIIVDNKYLKDEIIYLTVVQCQDKTPSSFFAI